MSPAAKAVSMILIIGLAYGVWSVVTVIIISWIST
jgi:hypothetical protein